MGFRTLHRCPVSAARSGLLQLAHGEVRTPVFMPVGTRASVKTVAPDELEQLGVGIVLGNTYHLMLRPGMEVIRAAGGLHRFMAWPHGILTDSGGYQVFSLADLRRVKPEGVTFHSHIDGRAHFLGPREAMAIQRDLGSDVAMAFDECTAYPATHEQAAASMRMTHVWAEQCRAQPRAPGQQVFGIVQGSMFADLRRESARVIAGLDFDGCAIGGLSVGEPAETMYEVVDYVVPELPAEKPRYLMGVGTPPQLVEAVARGVDMFDCVLPTRVARNGSAYTAEGMLQIKAARYKEDFSPIEAECTCPACRQFTRAYIRHLLNVGEILALRLVTLHNLHMYQRLMATMRAAIAEGSFEDFRAAFHARYQPPQRAGKAVP